MGYSFRLAAMVLLYAPSHRQDRTYHGLSYTSRRALARMRYSSMGPPHEGSIRRIMSELSYHGATSRSWWVSIAYHRVVTWERWRVGIDGLPQGGDQRKVKGGYRWPTTGWWPEKGEGWISMATHRVVTRERRRVGIDGLPKGGDQRKAKGG